MEPHVDAIVVGAGPAGSTAARYLAEKGVNALVVEKKQEIGTPKRCAEGINICGFENLGLKPDPRWVTNEITATVFYSPNGKRLLCKGVRGYILERKIFEKHLAMNAIRAGARYMVKTRALGVIKEDNAVRGIRAKFMGEEFKINSKLVIAADGVDSKIAKSAGIDTTNKITDYHSGFQYEMAGLNLEGHNSLHLYFGNDIAPKGYIWIFPKGRDVANVGMGILASKSEDGNRAKDYLDRFIEDHPEIFRNSSPIEINAGGIPVSSSVKPFVMNGLMLVGDAAQQVNPLHGGGMAIAMNAAKICAEVGAKAIKEGNVSGERLHEYENIWRETDGVKMQRLLRLRSFLEKLEDKDFDNLAEILSGEDIIRLTGAKYKFLIKVFARKAPSVLPLARKFLSD